MELTFEEAVQHLQDGWEVVLHCDGYDYEISKSDDWVGGDVGDGYISLVLGNIIYSDPETVLRKSINSLSEDGKEVTILLQ